MKKRMLSMLLAIVMVVGMLPATALAADGSVPKQVVSVQGQNDLNAKEYADITEAINVAKANPGSRFWLLYPITTTEPITIESGSDSVSFTIDLYGWTWTGSSPVLNIGGNVDITITDSFNSGKLRSTNETAHEIVLCDRANLKIDKGAIGSICYKGGTIDLSGNDDPTGIKIYNDTGAAVTPGDTTIKLPKDYVMLDGDNVANSLEVGKTYTVGSTPEQYPLWVGGKQVTSVNASDVFGDGTVSFIPAEGETPDTLTLNNYSYEGEGYESDGDAAAIYYAGNKTLNLVLEGKSTVTHKSETMPSSSCGIVNRMITEGDHSAGITVSGTGSLTANGGPATSQSIGVYAYGNITVNSGKLTGIGEDIQQGFSIGVYGYQLSVDGGSLTGIGNDRGVFSGIYNGITINGGEVVANSAERAFNFTPTIGGEFDPLVWYGESEADAMSNGVKDKSAIANTDNAKYVKIAPAVDYDLWVGGKRVTYANAYDVFGDGTATFDPDNNILTLTDYEYSGPGYEYDDWSQITAAIYSGLRELTIELEGENKLTNTADKGNGIYSDTILTITGDGSLAIHAGYDGIRTYNRAAARITISGCDVTIVASEYGIAGPLDYGVTITDSTVNIASKYGISLMGGLSITNSTVEITGETYAVYVSPFSLGEGAWYQWTTTEGGAMTSSKELPFVYNRQDSTLTYLKIEPQRYDVLVGGIAMVDGDYLASDATETTTDKPTSGGYAYYEDGVLTLNNYTYNGENNAIQYIGTQDSILMNINLVGESTVTLKNANSLGLTALRDITVSGSGSLSISGGSFGVSVMGDLIVNDGSLSAIGGSFGVSVRGDLTVNDGSLSANGDNFGVNVMGDLTVNDGSLSATGTIGVSVMGDLTINDGSLTATGGSKGVSLSPVGKFSLGTDVWYQWTTTEGGTMIHSTDTQFDYETNGTATYLKIEPLETSGTPIFPQYPTFPIIPPDPTYPPVVDGGDNGEVVVTPKNPEKGDTVTITAEPDKGYEVGEITVTDSKGNEVEVIDNGDGTYTYVQPVGKVTITVSYVPAGSPSEDYSDLSPDAWYIDAVDYVLRNGLMNGVGGDKFDPDGTTSRAMIVTMLWRLEGEPVVNYLMQFEDVAAETWYTEAVRWATAEGIVTGYNGKFNPNDAITREQMAAMLYRYEQYKGGGFTGMWMFLLDAADRDQVSEWAYEAMCWMSMNGIMTGDGSGALNPKGTASRTEVAQILKNYLEQD